jgi:hypothetical protein
VVLRGVTKPKGILASKRPARGVEEWLLGWLKCPTECNIKLERAGPYRRHWSLKTVDKRDRRRRQNIGMTARLRCPSCGLGFSVRVEEVAAAVQLKLWRDLGRDPDDPRAGDPSTIMRMIRWAEDVELAARIHPKMGYLERLDMQAWHRDRVKRIHANAASRSGSPANVRENLAEP